MLRVLIDIGHPAHVHLYKNAILEFKKSGNELIVTVKRNTAEQKLLDILGISYLELPEKAVSIVGKMLKQLHLTLLVLRILRRYRINMCLGSSITLSHAAFLAGVPYIIMDDDDDKVQPLFARFAHPFCSALLSPDALRGHRRKRDTVFYPGYHELAYLHPSRFSPDISVLSTCELKPGDSYFVLRFNAFKAHHDIGAKGLSTLQKLELVELLKDYGKIFITTEKDIEPELQEYQLSISQEKIHSLLYYAKIFLGDSQTMTSEASVLGIPALKCNTFAGKLSVPNELEDKYNLCYSFSPDQFDMFKLKLVDLLNTDNLKDIWQIKRQKMLKEKIDVTSFIIRFISDWTGSRAN